MAKRKIVGQKRLAKKSTPKAELKTAPTAGPTTKSAKPEPATVAARSTPTPARLLPTKSELGALYQRYTNGAAFDEHDKAFYFVLDVGGISRAKQLIAHVEEVLAELEEVRG